MNGCSAKRKTWMPPGKVRRNPKFHVRLRGTLNYYCIFFRCCRTVEVTERQLQRRQKKWQMEYTRVRVSSWESSWSSSSHHASLPSRSRADTRVVLERGPLRFRSLVSGLNDGASSFRALSAVGELFTKSRQMLIKVFFWICLLNMWSYANGK